MVFLLLKSSDFPTSFSSCQRHPNSAPIWNSGANPSCPGWPRDQIIQCKHPQNLAHFNTTCIFHKKLKAIKRKQNNINTNHHPTPKLEKKHENTCDHRLPWTKITPSTCRQCVDIIKSIALPRSLEGLASQINSTNQQICLSYQGNFRRFPLC